MQTRLTLRMDEAILRRAKRYGKRSGRLVSCLVSECFARVQSLLGALAGRKLSEDDHRRHLEQKHG